MKLGKKTGFNDNFKFEKSENFKPGVTANKHLNLNTYKYQGESVDFEDIYENSPGESTQEPLSTPETSVPKEADKIAKVEPQNGVHKEKEGESKKLVAYYLSKEFLKTHELMVYSDQLYLYDSTAGHYKLLRDIEMQRFIRNITPEKHKPYLNKGFLSEVVEFLYSECANKVTEDDLDKYKHILAFRDCVYDVLKKTYLPTSSKYPLLSSINYSYNKLIPKCNTYTLFHGFIDDITNCDSELKKLLGEVLGYLLSSYCGAKKAIFFIGPPNTGKTTLINLIVELIGKENVSSVPFDKLDQRFNRVALYGKKINCSAELTNKSLNSIDFFKQIVGNDFIQGEFKGKDSFSFKCRTKLLFAGNNSPSITELDETTAFFDRLLFIPFSQSINPDKRDTELIKKLLRDPAPIIDFAIDGLNSLVNNDFQFSYCQASENFKKAYIKEIDSINEFVENMLVCGDDSNKLFLDNLYAAYTDFCKNNCSHIFDIGVFRRQIANYGTLTKVRIGEITKSGVRGLKFKA